MNEPITERLATWDQFLNRWPLEQLSTITLEQYSAAGSQDCFTYWLEAGTESLGSIWGGSAFKFGIFSRGNDKETSDGSGRSYDSKYGWYTKYGDTPENAFSNVISEIVTVASSARLGLLEDVDNANLGDAFKWKLAFLYQNRDEPCILPIYKKEWLSAALDTQEKRVFVLQTKLMDDIGSLSILEYGDTVWSSIQKMIATELTPEEALAFFNKAPNFSQIKPPTKKLAGFESTNGLQIALELANETTTLYLSPGTWLDQLRDILGKTHQYGKNKARHSNLLANAPNLGIGNEIVRVIVPTKDALVSLCEAYTDSKSPTNNESSQAFGVRSMSPLNQILYGPPGTGKTYATVNKALEILEPEFASANAENRSALRKRFKELSAQGRIEFVTFHQSFSYEDFVEGLRATSEDGKISYEVDDGVFKRICVLDQAVVEKSSQAQIDISNRKIWKMSLGDTQGDDSYIYEHCIDQNELRLGYGSNLDFSGADDSEQIAKIYQREEIEAKTQDYRVTSVNIFKNRINNGDLIVVSNGNKKFRAIGEVTGDYEFKPDDSLMNYSQCRSVIWHKAWDRSLPNDQLLYKTFSQMTLYQLKPKVLRADKLAELLGTADGSENAAGQPHRLYPGMHLAGGRYEVTYASEDMVRVLVNRTGSSICFDMMLLEELEQYVADGKITIEDIKQKRVFDRTESTLEKYMVNGYPGLLAEMITKMTTQETAAQKPQTTQTRARVLIIDEINRGNIANIFGELITLIEPTKRAAAAEAIEVTLPYSKDRFSVPSNIYIIGTMNTADRSLVHVDTALRRRFTFIETPPNLEVLADITVEGVSIRRLLETINNRIELIYDREHRIGHSYFLPLKEEPTIEKLASIFSNQIVPLLEEYFFDDWSRIQQVLRIAGKEYSHFVEPKFSNIQAQEILGDQADQAGVVYQKAFSAMLDPAAYISLYEAGIAE
jgi:5-methylcytosine-specific restriction enzyme B